MARIGRRFEEALGYATRLHARQPRKRRGDDLPFIPYLSHLLGVASLVLEVDGSEEEAMAALLHDAVEDHPHRGRTCREIGRDFGPEVLEIVLWCTKAPVDGSGPPAAVRARRRRQSREYVERLRRAPPSVKLVAAADKLHNARAIVSDLRHHGQRAWGWFNKGRAGTLAYYADLAVALRGGDLRSRRLVDELGRVVREMRRLAGAPRA